MQHLHPTVYSVLGAENHVNEIKEKADGQKVKTYVKSNGYENPRDQATLRGSAGLSHLRVAGGP